MDSKRLDIILIAGEQSGDLLGAKLIQTLLEKNPTLRIGAVAGPQMRKEKITTLFPMEKLQVMGFFDVFFSLPQIIRAFFTIRKAIVKASPKAVVCIDYPGFNLRLAKSLRKKKYQGLLIQYVCPSVWAWKKGRIGLIERTYDLLLTLLPFEKEIFKPSRLEIEYVGHPLTSEIAPSFLQKEDLVAIFPGSRFSEIEKNLPLQLAAAQKLGYPIAISISHPEKEQLIRMIAKDVPCEFVSKEHSYELMQRAKLCLATSGTVTLELALHATPTIVQYFIRPFEVFLAKYVFRIKLPFYALPNIIAGKEIFPEFFGPYLSEEAVVRAARSMNLETCVKKCLELRSTLATQNGSDGAALHILQRMAKVVQ